MRFFERRWRILILSTVAAVCCSGCGDSDDSDGGYGNPNDGNTYEVMAAGGKKWTTKNLNIETGNSWCYENKASNCAKYGRLYDWATAMGVDTAYNSDRWGNFDSITIGDSVIRRREICPGGGRLPKDKDWEDLIAAVGGGDTAGRALKAKSGWAYKGNGTGNFKFSALPGGYRNVGGNYSHIGDYGGWWTATESDRSGAVYRYMDYGLDFVGRGNIDKRVGYYVRCVKE